MPVSSIASPRRTDAPRGAWAAAGAAPASRSREGSGSREKPGARDKTATIVAGLLLAVLLLSFRPFQPGGSGVEGGDLVNQLGFSVLGAVALLALAGFPPPRLVVALWGPWMLLLFALFLVSIVNAIDPASAARAASFTVIGVLGIGAVLTVPRSPDGFSSALAIAALVVLAVCYAGIAALPDVARHSADSQEPQHAGLWRGAFSHKNVAGPVMACLSFAGVYLFRRGWRWRGGAVFLLAIVFTFNTGSKTTGGLVPLTILIVVLPGLIGLRGVTTLLTAAALAGTALGTLGIVFIAPLKAFAAAHFPDLTYTGRTTLWEFSGEMLAKKPWFGYGYDSFWGSAWLAGQDQPFDRAWDIRTIVHGHDGYLDIAVTMGLPALAVAAVAFLVEPLRDYLRVPPVKENVWIADFFLMITLFTSLNAFLESFFFRRADPVWLFFMMGVMGLRLAARFPMTGPPPIR